METRKAGGRLLLHEFSIRITSQARMERVPDGSRAGHTVRPLEIAGVTQTEGGGGRRLWASSSRGQRVGAGKEAEADGGAGRARVRGYVRAWARPIARRALGGCPGRLGRGGGRDGGRPGQP